MIIKHWK